MWHYDGVDEWKTSQSPIKCWKCWLGDETFPAYGRNGNNSGKSLFAVFMIWSQPKFYLSSSSQEIYLHFKAYNA